VLSIHVDSLKVWFLIAILIGPLLALFLPHNIAIILIGCYLAGSVILAFTNSPECPWKMG